MAPKKTLLILTLVLFASFTAAQSNEIRSTSHEKIWVGSDDKFEIQIDFSDDCLNERVEKAAPDEFEHNPADETSGGSDQYTNYTYSGLNYPGVYNFTAACDDSSKNSETVSVNVDKFKISLSGLPENDDASHDGVEYGESFDGGIEVEAENGLIDVSTSEISMSSSGLENFDDNGDSFSAAAPETGSESVDQLNFDVTAELDSDNSVSDTVSDKVILDPYSVEDFTTLVSGDSVNQRVKFRRMQDVSLESKLLKRGSPITDLSLDDFEFDGNSGSEWFDMNNQGSGNYKLDLKRTTSPEGSGYKELDYPISVDSNSDSFDIGGLKMEREVEFSGRVLDINRGSVSTTFTAIFDEGGETTGSTNQNGRFQFYFSENKADRLDIDFPKAGFSLDQFNFVREGPSSTGSNVDDIRYNYYEKPEENLDLSVNGVRPINLMSAKVDYGFKENIDNTRGYMEYDSSRVDNYDKVEIYECSYWEFEAESCATEWEEIPENDVGFYSTSVPEFPVKPLSSDRFRGVDNILSNAYLVGVPRGVGSSLSLQDNLDVSSTSLQSGEELSVSGTVIDSSTDEGVGGADVSLELVDGDNIVSFDSLETESDGSFEFSKEIEESGEYTAEFSAEKSPYDSFSKESSRTIDVFYETGLTVSSESDIDLQMGESSEIEFDIKNSGQSEVEDIELEVSGIDEEYYTLSTNTVSSLGTDDVTRTVTLSLDKPEDYCSDPCTSPPTISLSASGTSAGETVENSASVYTNIPANTQQEQASEDTEEPDQEEQNQSSLDVPGPDQVSQMTGDFIESQKDMNLALGIILIFGAILAVTVRRRKEGGDDRTNRVQGRMSHSAAGSARGNVQRPDVSPSSEEEGGQAESEDDVEPVQETNGDGEVETGGGKEEGSDESDGGVVCDTCGEEFDTESGLKLHEDALH